MTTPEPELEYRLFFVSIPHFHEAREQQSVPWEASGWSPILMVNDPVIARVVILASRRK